MNPQAQDRYQRIIQELGQIPTMPVVAQKVMQIVNDPGSSAEDVARFIGKDVALTSKVLRLANSAFYGIPRTISSVNSAVVILGFNTIRSLVLSASVLRVFPDKPGAASFDRKAFWKHSFMAGIATRMLAQRLRRRRMIDLEAAFSAGLLHDIGKVILDQFAHEEYAPVLKSARERGRPLCEAEAEALGISHAEVSGMLIEKWQMPPELRAPLALHHNPLSDAESAEMASLVHLGNHLCHLRGSGCMRDEAFQALDPRVPEALGVEATEAELAADLEVQLQGADAFFSLIEGG